MKIKVLVENNTRIDNYLIAEPALSLLIELKDKKVLFDCGYGDLFLSNAGKMNVDLSDLSDVVISHGHNDHTGGLGFLKPEKRVLLTAHPGIFDEKKDETGSYGCPYKKEGLEKTFKLNLTKKPYEISPELIFAGKIENNVSDDIDDSAVIYKAKKGLFIITACSHAGILNIINAAKKITGIDKIYGIFGGFHLLDKSEDEIIKIAKAFKKEKVEFLAPCHCCDLKSKIILSKYLDIVEVCTGDEFEII